MQKSFKKFFISIILCLLISVAAFAVFLIPQRGVEAEIQPRTGLNPMINGCKKGQLSVFYLIANNKDTPVAVITLRTELAAREEGLVKKVAIGVAVTIDIERTSGSDRFKVDNTDITIENSVTGSSYSNTSVVPVGSNSVSSDGFTMTVDNNSTNASSGSDLFRLSGNTNVNLSFAVLRVVDVLYGNLPTFNITIDRFNIRGIVFAPDFEVNDDYVMHTYAYNSTNGNVGYADTCTTNASNADRISAYGVNVY